MRIPVSTYRLQLRAGVDLARAGALLDRLLELGITDLYLSPIFEAEPGSEHGYDVVSHERIDPAIGGDAGLRALAAAARERGIGLIVDWVPNHVSVASHHNHAWNEVLEHGRASPHAAAFDIDWSPPRIGLEGRILLPILGDSYGRALERGELRIARDGGRLHLAYFERRLPLAAATLAPLMMRASSLGHGALAEIAGELAALPSPRTATRFAPERIEEAHRALARLERAIARDAGPIDRAIEEWNATIERLHALIAAQVYRPSAWRLALERINYRRFFDVDHLAAIRMEEPAVFDAAHRALLGWIGEGAITGLRLDHIDGLADPEGYFARLQAECARALGAPPEGNAFWIVAEKILGAHEHLPRAFRIHGTTGYEVARLFTGVLIDPRGVAALDPFYARFTGDRRHFAGHVHRAKLAVLRTTFASEVRALADRLERIASADLRWCDLTPSALTSALEETVAAFPVYRSYVRPHGERARDDHARIARALRTARRRTPERVADALDFLEEVLRAEPLSAEDPRAEFVTRFQQLTGPATAKAVEDTAFYRYVRFLAANEVGSEPEQPAISIEDLHRANAFRAEAWPHSMVCTSTHDTKRGEDGRARLAALSEVPDELRHAISRWSRRARGKRTVLEDGEAPGRRVEMLFYQSLIGCWPFGALDLEELARRMAAFLEKGIREAKERTSWIRPDEEYESACRTFVVRMLADRTFTDDVAALCGRLRDATVSNALAQVVLRCLSPGVPDLYQGSELWNVSLVDPDNRRPVDFDRIGALLGELRAGADPAALLAEPGDARIKLWVTQRALRARAQARELYQSGGYAPLEGGEHCIAFARIDPRHAHVASVTRLPIGLAAGRSPIGSAWGDRRLRGEVLATGTRWRCALTDRELVADDGLALADVHAILPCALLVRT